MLNSSDDFAQLTTLSEFVMSCKPLMVLTGAGCSTGSGLGDYRNKKGEWKRAQPITGQIFIHDESARKIYWARSAAGWQSFSQAKPNNAHHSLTELSYSGYVERLVTQNVDGLHQKAGHSNVIDLHGRLDTVSCVCCRHTIDRHRFQQELLISNPDLSMYVSKQAANPAPDGDSDIEFVSYDALVIPNCPNCGGLFKPDVVFFGENVPKARVEEAMSSLRKSNGLLVVGSSLMVYSGFRFCKYAHAQRIPIAILNDGKTRADELAQLKIAADCASTLENLADSIASEHHQRG